MSDYRTWRGGREHRQSLLANAKSIFQLAPRQFSDEASLAVRELKGKGVRVGVGAGLLFAALLFLAFLLTALVVAAIAGLATIMPAWLSALLFAALFLVILAILALIGLLWVKKALPLVPQEAVRGVKHDLGILRVGSGFDVSSLEKKDSEKDSDDDDSTQEKKEKPAPVSDDELRERISQRREHLTFLRDRVSEQSNIKAQATHLINDPTTPVGRVRERWLPITGAVAAFTTLLVLVRKLLKRGK